MKRYLSLCLMASSMLVAASAAYAAPVFMLQFGSFESQSEAQTKLQALQQKHAGVLSRLQLGVREVRLPPDNLPVYRTQAGPLATRDDAQSVCAQLASNGDECYVVETAMETSPGQPLTQTASAVPAAPAAPTVMAPSMPAMPAPSAPAAPVVNAAPVPSAAAPVDMAARDPQSVAAMNSVTASSTISQPAADAALSADMDQALAQQAASPLTQPSPFADSAVGVSPATTATHIADTEARQHAAPQKSRSLWDRIFGDDEDDADTAAPARPAPALAAPALPDNSVLSSPVAPAAPMPVMAAAQPVSQPMAAPAAPVITQAEPYPLPPPPAPLVGRDVPVAGATPVAAAPISTGTLPPPSAAAAMPDANVRVEEARRVPLTQTPIAPVAATPVAIPPSLSPSATLGQKTLWAEVGHFRDAQAALGYWNNYRRVHPDFPVVRVRVASPLMAQRHGLLSVNLRIGPFERYSTIQHLCETLPGTDDGLQCGYVTDMGVASGAEPPQPGYLSGSRYHR